MNATTFCLLKANDTNKYKLKFVDELKCMTHRTKFGYRHGQDERRSKVWKRSQMFQRHQSLQQVIDWRQLLFVREDKEKYPRMEEVLTVCFRSLCTSELQLLFQRFDFGEQTSIVRSLSTLVECVVFLHLGLNVRRRQTTFFSMNDFFFDDSFALEVVSSFDSDFQVVESGCLVFMVATEEPLKPRRYVPPGRVRSFAGPPGPHSSAPSPRWGSARL